MRELTASAFIELSLMVCNWIIFLSMINHFCKILIHLSVENVVLHLEHL
jgi:hypothetical protein